MTSKLSNFRRFLILLSVVWFAGYASATAVCANSCPDCVSVSASVNSCNASCAAVSVPSHEVLVFKSTKPLKEIADFALIYASVDTANIWKPPKQAVPSSLPLVI
jgi:hypothetical protein